LAFKGHDGGDIEQVRRAADIVDVVGNHVALKRHGSEFLGLCPFHHEKTASFSVNPEKQVFYCHGCHAGGTVFDFLMKHERLSFAEALNTLARRYNVELAPPSPGQRRKKEEREELYEINERAASFYARMLSGPDGGTARRYLAGRGMDGPVAAEFGLGWAPEGWRNLLDHLTRVKISPEKAARAGLAVKGDKGYYDRFRARIMFPIKDAYGRVTAFGGRVLTDEKPKYINSEQTPVYDKKRTLYAWAQSRAACRDARSVSVVEGYFDALALWAAGVKNVAAPCGTALTEEHVRLIRGLCDSAFLVFDADTAGVRAAEKSLPLFMNQGVEARVLSLPDGHDPDSFVRKNGPEAFTEAARQSRDLFAFLTDMAVSRHTLSMEGRARVAAEMAGHLARVGDPVKRSVLVRDLARRLDIHESALLEQVRQTAGGAGESPRPGPAAPAPRPGLAASALRMERQVVDLMRRFAHVAREVAEKGLLAHFQDPVLGAMAQRIARAWEGREDGDDPDFIALAESEDERRVLARLIHEECPVDPDACPGIIRQFSHRAYRAASRELEEKIRRAQEQGDARALMALLEEKKRIRTQA